jgi:hypothetical protein
MNNLAVSEIIYFRESRGVVTHGFHIDRPVMGVLVSGDLFLVAGWVVGKTSRAVEVNALLSEELVAVGMVNINRPDIERAFPTVEEAISSGFRLEIPLISLQSVSKLKLVAKLADGTQVPLADICFEKQADEGSPKEYGNKEIGNLSGQGIFPTENENATNILPRDALTIGKSVQPKSRKKSVKRKKSR